MRRFIGKTVTTSRCLTPYASGWTKIPERAIQPGTPCKVLDVMTDLWGDWSYCTLDFGNSVIYEWLWVGNVRWPTGS